MFASRPRLLKWGAIKAATNYNGDKPKRRQPERRQNGKAKTATHLNGDNENGDSLWTGLRCLCCVNLVTWVRLISRRWIRFCKVRQQCYVTARPFPYVHYATNESWWNNRRHCHKVGKKHRSDDSVNSHCSLGWAVELTSVKQAIALFKRRNGFSSLLQSWVKLQLHRNMKVKLQCPTWISQCAGT